MTRRGFVRIDGGELYYELDGGGPPIVLIAGGFQDVRMYASQVEALSVDSCLVRCELRGYGRSSVPTDREYRHCDDLRRLLDELNIERAFIGGQSLGGTVALDFALAYPDRVAGLILAPALPVLGWKWVEGFPVAPAYETARSLGVEAFADAFLDLPLSAGARSNVEVAASLREMIGDYTGWHLVNRDPGRFEAPDAIDRLHEIVAPTLILVGGIDVLDSRLVADRLGREIPDAEHHLIEHVGHAPNMEDPHLFNQLVTDFVDRVRPPSS